MNHARGCLNAKFGVFAFEIESEYVREQMEKIDRSSDRDMYYFKMTLSLGVETVCRVIIFVDLRKTRSIKFRMCNTS